MEEPFEGNTDDLISQMMADEVVGATKMKPRDFAKLRGVAPQLVYYHIRNGHIKTESCLCGATVVDVVQANEFWDNKDRKKSGRGNEEEAGGADQGRDDTVQ